MNDVIGMDQPITPSFWAGWPLGLRFGAAIGGLAAVCLTAAALLHDSGDPTARIAKSEVTISTVDSGLFHDSVPLKARVVPRDIIYLDATEGGRVERVLVEPGDIVAAGQLLIEFGNTNLQLQVIQQESQLNQAISQLQQNEIALEQNKIANDRSLAQIEYNVTRLSRSFARREDLASKGVTAIEQRDLIRDELDYNRAIRPMQATGNERQDALRARLLPEIHAQLEKLRLDLETVRGKLDDLVIRSPAAGRVTSIDLKTGETRSPGQRLAEIAPFTGYKLSADIDEFYLSRVRSGQQADFMSNSASVARIYPRVKDSHFTIDLFFAGQAPADLVAGQTLQGKLSLGDDRPALLLPAGAFLEQTGGDWIFVLNDRNVGVRRRIKLGRRGGEQVEVLAGLRQGERVITSDYSGFDRIQRIIVTGE